MTDEQLFVVAGFHSVQGTLVVTASSPESVEGTFAFSAREAGEGGRMVNVNGTFTSLNQDG